MDQKQTLREMLHLDDDEILDRILSQAEVKSFGKGEDIYEYGKIPENAGFLLSGVVAALEPNEHGAIRIDCITDIPGTPMLPGSGLGNPAYHTARVLAPAQVLSCPADFLAGLLEEYPALQRSFFDILLFCAQESREEKMILHNSNVHERYAWFLKKHPHFPQRGLNKYIAAYLNTTPETISRIRRERKKAAEQA